MTPVIPEDSWSGGFLVIGPSGKGSLFQLLLCSSSCLINGSFITGQCSKWGELGSPFFQCHTWMGAGYVMRQVDNIFISIRRIVHAL